MKMADTSSPKRVRDQTAECPPSHEESSAVNHDVSEMVQCLPNLLTPQAVSTSFIDGMKDKLVLMADMATLLTRVLMLAIDCLLLA